MLIGRMDRKALMQSVAVRAFDARIGLGALCSMAGVSRTVAARWEAGANTPSLPTIGKLERALETVVERQSA